MFDDVACSEELVKGDDAVLTRSDLQTLAPTKWIVDKVHTNPRLRCCVLVIII